MEYKYGATGFVELYADIVKKYSEYDHLFWLKESSILHYLWVYRTDNIIKCKSEQIIKKIDPTTSKLKTYHESTFERHATTLHHRKLYRDSDIVQFMLDITSAMKFLNSKNIYHRDIKPDNIAVTHSGRFILLDFSHSYKAEFPIPLDPQVTTYYYRAPEVFKYLREGSPVYNLQLDVWSLGLVLAELLTHMPFIKYWIPTHPTQPTHDVDTDHDELEGRYEELLLNPKATRDAIMNFVCYKSKKFEYTSKYWLWVYKMTAYNAAERISFADMYDDVLRFANNNNIKFVEPVNGVLEHDVQIPLQCTAKVDQELFVACKRYIKTNIRLYNMSVNPERIYDVLEFMIQTSDLYNKNYKDMCAALLIIAETVLFDMLTGMHTYTTLNTDNTRAAIATIMRKYKKHLFGVNKIFTYETPDEKIANLLQKNL